MSINTFEEILQKKLLKENNRIEEIDKISDENPKSDYFSTYKYHTGRRDVLKELIKSIKELEDDK